MELIIGLFEINDQCFYNLSEGITDLYVVDTLDFPEFCEVSEINDDVLESKRIIITNQNTNDYTWDNKKVNQLEAINIIKDTAKEYLLSLNDTDCYKQDKALKKFCEVMELWGMILPAMWT